MSSAKVEKKEKTTVDVQDVLQEKAKQSLKNIQNGKEEVKVSLTDNIEVRFKKDYGFMKKDQTATVSELAYEVYSKAGVVDKI